MKEKAKYIKNTILDNFDVKKVHVEINGEWIYIKLNIDSYITKTEEDVVTSNARNLMKMIISETIHYGNTYIKLKGKKLKSSNVVKNKGFIWSYATRGEFTKYKGMPIYFYSKEYYALLNSFKRGTLFYPSKRMEEYLGV